MAQEKVVGDFFQLCLENGSLFLAAIHRAATSFLHKTELILKKLNIYTTEIIIDAVTASSFQLPNPTAYKEIRLCSQEPPYKQNTHRSSQNSCL